VLDGSDLDDVAQPFLTDVLMALHLAATLGLVVPEPLADSAGSFIDRFAKIDDDDSSWGLADTVAVTARAFAVLGQNKTSSDLATAAADLRVKARRQPIDVHGISGWGRLHRGDIVSSLHDDAETWIKGLPALEGPS
jgi:hypothetical protein